MKARRIEIGFGVGEDGRGKRIPLKERKRRLGFLIKETSRRFGGCFVYSGAGGWVYDAGQLVEEPGLVLRVWTSASRGRARRLARLVREVFEQTAVLLDDAGRLEEVRA